MDASPEQPDPRAADEHEEPPADEELESLAMELRQVLGTGAADRLDAEEEHAAASADSANPHDAGTAPASPSPLGIPKPGDRFGGFELLTELGRGGMGVVFRAKQVSLNRLVALKLLQADALDSPDRLLRFRNECRAVAKLSHPAVVPIYAQGEFGSVLYYAMELVEGESLDHLPAQAAPPPGLREEGDVNRTWAGRFAEIAHALQHAHSKQVYHRDIKPGNLILDREGKLRILDFGIARLVDMPSLTITGQILGTPAYLAPEQVGAEIGSGRETGSSRVSLTQSGGTSAGDHRSDIYSLGVTLYEVLTGTVPFHSGGIAETLRRVAEEEPTPPRKLNPAISRDMEAVILHAMRKDPGRRYQLAADFAHDLEAIAGDAPVRARRASLVERTWRWTRAHQALAAVVALGGVLSVVLLLTDQYLVLLLGLILLGLIGGQLNLARRREMNRLVEESLQHLLRESYLDLETVQPKLARAQRLGCRSTDFQVTQAITCIGKSPDQAEKLLEKILDREPRHRAAMYLLAWASRLQGRHEECGQWLRRADELGAPLSPEECFLCGLAALTTDSERAIACLRRAIAMRPGFTQAMLHLGRALNQWLYHHRRLDHLSEQTTCLESLCILRPASAYPRYLLSLTYRLAAEVHEQLAGDANSEVERTEHRANVQTLFAKAYQTAKQAQLVEPTSRRGYAAEAEYCEKTQDLYGAIAAWDTAFRYESHWSTRIEVHQYRFRLEWWTGQLDRALWDLEALHLLAPEDPFLTILYPTLLRTEWGQPAQARELLRIAEQAADNCPAARHVCVATRRLLGATRATGRLVEFEPAESNPDGADFPPADLFFGGVEALTQGDGPTAVRWLDAAVRTYDNEEYTFHALALVTKLRRQPNWPAEMVSLAQNS
jgi:tetratricopeptide (TPR) repeat protein